MTTKKVTKVSKNVVKKAAAKKPVVPKDDGIYWVVSERKFLTWKPILVFKDRISANAARSAKEIYGGFSGYKVDRVTLED